MVPALRFWVSQDGSSGAGEGRTVDDLTASGANYRTRIFENLEVPSSDVFVAMVKKVSELFPEEVWGEPMFVKQNIRMILQFKISKKKNVFSIYLLSAYVPGP